MDPEATKSQTITYYEKSKLVYALLLYHAKHLGFHPDGIRIPEKKAHMLMHDLVAEKIDLTGGVTVLDAGCGEGVVSTYLASKIRCRIIGITLVPYEIGSANALASSLGVSDLVEYHIKDFSVTGFPADYFDAVYATEALVHSPDIRQTFREFHRVLKPNGKIAFCEYRMAEDQHLSPQDINIIDMVIEETAMPALRLFRYNQVTKLLEEADFRNICSEDITDNIKPSVYRLKRFFAIPYFFVKLLRLQRKFISLTGLTEFSNMGDRGLFKYKIVNAEK